MTRRHLPYSEIDDHQTKLLLSRISPDQEYSNNRGVGKVPSNNDPFNPILSQDVVVSENSYLTNRRPVLTPYMNREPKEDPQQIALYATRQDAPSQYTNNKLFQMLKNRSESKVSQATDQDFMPTANPNVGFIQYNKEIPISESNHPHFNENNLFSNDADEYQDEFDIFNRKSETGGAQLVDRRINNFTQMRIYNTAEDRADMAYDLQRSDAIKERNRRQEESDAAFLHMAKRPRWVEHRMGYLSREVDPSYVIDPKVREEMTQRSERKNKLNEVRQVEAFSRKRKGDDANFNELNPLRLKREIDHGYADEIDRTFVKQATGDIVNSRYESFRRFKDNDGDKTTPSAYVAPKEHKESFFTTIVDTIVSLFGGKKYKQDECQSQRVQFDDNKIKPIVPIIVGGDWKVSKHRYHNKKIYIMRNGEIQEVFPEEQNNVLTSYIITKDPTDNKLNRTFVVKNLDTIKIIQKRAGPINTDYESDEYSMVTVPIHALTDEFRQKIRKNNLDNPREILKLDYDDLYELDNIVSMNPDKQCRIRGHDISQLIRGELYDTEWDNEFADRRPNSDVIVKNPVLSRRQRVRDVLTRLDNDKEWQPEQYVSMKVESPINKDRKVETPQNKIRCVTLEKKFNMNNFNKNDKRNTYNTPFK
jgi:hypothetical protein